MIDKEKQYILALITPRMIDEFVTLLYQILNQATSTDLPNYRHFNLCKDMKKSK
jgi:hypothetical protein